MPAVCNVRENSNLDETERVLGENSSPEQLQINILQWNACSLNEEKRIQLERLALKERVDVICVSELGQYRKLNGFPKYTDCYKKYTKRNFLENGMKVKIINNNLNKKHQGINNQCIWINGELLIVHPYIPSRISRSDRSLY
jgi:hypothetical protein